MIQFHRVYKGKKYYKIFLYGREVFCGTRGECQRFIKVHNEKVRREIGRNKPIPKPKDGNIRRVRVVIDRIGSLK